MFDSGQIRNARKILEERIASELGTRVEKIKIITYMPTFRDKASQGFSFSRLLEDERFLHLIDDYNIIIIQKAHEANIRRGEKFAVNYSDRILNIQDIQPQILLAASDILVTDYSSCFFDFLLLDRPIIFYMYDYLYYANKDRGLYFSKEDILCGLNPEKEDDLITAIQKTITKDEHSGMRQKIKSKYMTFESENNCEIILKNIEDEIVKETIS